jgi:hypothetical protein
MKCELPPYPLCRVLFMPHTFIRVKSSCLMPSPCVKLSAVDFLWRRTELKCTGWLFLLPSGIIITHLTTERKVFPIKNIFPHHPCARKEMIVESAINHLPLFLMSSLSYFELINSSSLAPKSSQVKPLGRSQSQQDARTINQTAHTSA